MPPGTRDDLIDEVRYGRMTPDQAEAEAARLGLGKLASEPEDGTFDPMGETWWTLPMAVAWIAWRTPKLVRAHWPAFREQCWDWHYREWRIGFDGPVYSGHFLEQRREANLPILRLSEAYDTAHGLIPANSISVRQAQKKLWDALAEGIPEGYGTDTTTGEREIIPAMHWRRLDDYIEGRNFLCTDRIRLTRPGYEEIAFRRQAIMALWPPHRREEWDAQLPATVRPEGPGYMPLYCAAQWIATEGGSIAFDPRANPIWQEAYAKLLARIATAEVAITGIRDGVGARPDPLLFASLRVDYPFSNQPDDLAFSDEIYLSSCAYIDEQHWRNGFDDNLRSRRGVTWARLQVLKADVALWWPMGLPCEPNDAHAVYRTGAPGRPTSMHLVQAEHMARWDRREADRSVREESRLLAAWLKAKHPAAPRLTAKAIENKIRTEHNVRKTNARN